MTNEFRNYPYIKLSEQGNIIEVTGLTKRNKKCHAQKLNKDEYMLLSTGEILEYEHKEKRLDNIRALYRTFRHIRELVNTNCTDAKKLRWITLTYKENMTDTEKLYRDFKNFWKRFTYQAQKAAQEVPEYISVIEPQGRGAWHVHLMLIYAQDAPFIPAKRLSELWGHGFVRIKAVNNCDNFGAYLSAYLADVEVPEGTEGSTEKKLPDGTTKAILKGGRLNMYPVGMNLYRCSRGIKKPKESWVPPDEVETRLQGLEPTYSSTEVHIDQETGFKFQIHKEYYNKLRRK